jgi:cbb3-type cytochrome oxidase maturation protein
MSVFIALSIFSILIFGLLLSGLIWNIRSGQWDDLAAPKDRMLWDDPKKETNDKP